eukprot:snap_masked-scaffold_25-processed-gene-3.45-mRNA-1 protein AED:0.37 eAED:0.58 QI:0/-1/0/1/-1/1/1/0/137
MPLFKIPSLAMLHTEKKDFIFFKTFLTIAWNLMCRAVNTFDIHYRRLTWKEKALCIIFCHQKNDQAGEKLEILDTFTLFCYNLKFVLLCPLTYTGQTLGLEMVPLFLVETINTTDLEKVRKEFLVSMRLRTSLGEEI